MEKMAKGAGNNMIEAQQKDIISSYVGKQVVMEIERIYGNVVSGKLIQYDGKFALIEDYRMHKENANIKDTITESSQSLDRNPGHDITRLKRKDSVQYIIPSVAINVNQIASITTLDSILEARDRENRELEQK
mgnify:CR=1 FL=1